jgi:Flp pilus assembly protein TadD
MRKREVVEAHKAIAEGLDAVLQNDFESAYKLFKQARKLAPDDAGVRDAMYFADGVIFKSPRGKSGEWQMEKGFEWEIYTNELFPETQRSDEVHKLYLKALDKIPSGNYEGALKFLKQLYKRNPADQEIRDKINWLEGICSQRYSVTRQKNKAVSREAK